VIPTFLPSACSRHDPGRLPAGYRQSGQSAPAELAPVCLSRRTSCDWFP